MTPELVALLTKLSEDKTTVQTDEPRTRGDNESVLGLGLKNMIAFGAGTGAGIGAGHLLDKAYEHYTGRPAPFLVPATGMAAGLASTYLYNKVKAHEIERMQDAFQRKRNGAEGRSSG